MLATLVARRLEMCRREPFTAPGAGVQRRRMVAEVTRDRLTSAWQEARRGMPRDGLALAAVGSLARGESGPLSDLDLVLLHDGRTAPVLIAELADRLWYPLWDCGLRLDHSVRTLADCRAVADDDVSALVGLLDLDLVAGDADLVTAARSGVARDWRCAARRRLTALVEEIAARHARCGDLSQLNEPDLKEAHGGLRDLSMMRALAASWLADYPRFGVEAAATRLLDVRDALQLASGRPRARLARQEHDAVAALLGLADGDALLASVGEAARVIALASDATLRRAGQAQQARTLRVGPRGPQLRPLGHGVYEHQGEAVLGRVALTRAKRPGGDPWLPLRALATAAREALPPAPTTIQTLATQPAPSRPWPEPARALFVDLLATGEGLIGVWEAASVARIVDGWLPVWSILRNRAHHDPLHRHTVDRHSVQVVVEACAFVADVRRPDLLLLSALLHDVGKARAGVGHAGVGASIARTALRELGFDEADVDVVALLVAEHLTLVSLATRRDVEDPATVDALVEVVRGQEDILDLLEALTKADAMAVGDRAWTTWRAYLVSDLVGRARTALRGPLRVPVRAGTGGASAPFPGSPGALGDDREPFAVGAAARAAAMAGSPTVTVRPGADPESLAVDVVAADRLGLFGDMAGAFTRQGARVRRALLVTVDGLAVDRWDVELAGSCGLDAAALARDISGGVQTTAARRDGRVAPAPLPRTEASAAHTPTPSAFQAYVVPDASRRATVIELRGPDRPRLLRDVGHALGRLEMTVHSAHIETYAGRCLDTFYVTESGASITEAGPGILRPARVAEVISALVDVGESGAIG